MTWSIGSRKYLHTRNFAFTPLEKATDEVGGGMPYKADGGFQPEADPPLVEKPPSAHTVSPVRNNGHLRYPISNGVRERSSLTGFSLLEVLVVVVIVGAILALSLPRFRGTFNNLQFQNFYQNLLARMHYLNERASVEQAIYRLNFDLVAKRVAIAGTSSGDDAFEKVRGHLGKAIAIPEGIEIEVEPLSIFFLPDGSIAGNDIHIRDSHRSVTIKINNSLGRLSLEENEESQ